ncbi:MAG: NAD(P)/FAD-dependent oxidoreductase [Crocinitomicaceae bacterium]|jgi:glycine/D-amino acid oxidase-like deaminating enzyme
MLSFNDLSFWEKSTYFNGNDFVIIGSGIVGLSTSIFLKNKFPHSKVLILERGYLPTGASTKNAGFACFGSPTELYDDLKTIPENKVWDTFEMRYEGLRTLFDLIDPKKIDYENCASWDLIENPNLDIPLEFLDYLNENAKRITKNEQVYSVDNSIIERFRFSNIHSAYKNCLEGSLNTGKLIQELYKEAIASDVSVLFGIELLDYQITANNVLLETKYGEISSSNLIICTNGFAKKFIGDRVNPARAQVLITKPIPNLRINGTFHLDRGYYYFRNVGERILLGGGRNLDFKGETTEEAKTTQFIQNKLIELLQNTILTNQDFEIDYSWAGVMGVGSEKVPIIEKMNNRVAIGVRMGGMGVAIGSDVGKKLANLF